MNWLGLGVFVVASLIVVIYGWLECKRAPYYDEKTGRFWVYETDPDFNTWPNPCPGCGRPSNAIRTWDYKYIGCDCPPCGIVWADTKTTRTTGARYKGKGLCPTCGFNHPKGRACGPDVREEEQRLCWVCGKSFLVIFVNEKIIAYAPGCICYHEQEYQKSTRGGVNEKS